MRLLRATSSLIWTLSEMEHSQLLWAIFSSALTTPFNLNKLKSRCMIKRNIWNPASISSLFLSLLVLLERQKSFRHPPGAVSLGYSSSWQVRHLRAGISSSWSIGLVPWGWDGLSGDRVSVWSRLRAGGPTLPQWGLNSPHQPGRMTGICQAVQTDPMGLEMPCLCVVLNNW